MSKTTETWVLRHLKSTETQKQMQISSTYHNFATGETTKILITGEITSRSLLPTDQLLNIFLFDEVRIDGKRYLQKTFEVAKPGHKETELQIRDKKIVNFLKNHYEVSHKKLDGTEQNKNIVEGGKIYFLLTNLDEKETEQAELDIAINEMMLELASLRETPEDIINLAFGVGINPVGLSEDTIFNLISKKVKENPKWFKTFLHEDSDKIYKIVVNKALRTHKGEGEGNFIVEDLTGNYRMNDQLIASSMEKLVLYFKENKEMFEFLQNNLGFKKKEQNLTSTPSQEVKKPGRPAKHS